VASSVMVFILRFMQTQLLDQKVISGERDTTMIQQGCIYL